MNLTRVTVEWRRPILTITLNRPERRNAMDRQMLDELLGLMRKDALNPDVAAVVLTGTGTHCFCGGADLGELIGGTKSETEHFVNDLDELLYLINSLPVPVVAVLNGHAFGGGAYLAAACDIRLAIPETKFVFSGVNWGLVLGTWLLPQVVGYPAARDLLMTARPVADEEAIRLGLVQQLVPRDGMAAAVAEVTSRLAENHPEAVRMCKSLLANPDLPRDEVRRRAREITSANAGTPDFKRRMEAVGGAKRQASVPRATE